jgi:hypothetical protein
MSFSVGAGTTGTFSDTSSYDTIIASDKIDNSVTVGGTTGFVTFRMFGTTIGQISAESINVSDSGTGDDSSIVIEEHLARTDSGTGSDSMTVEEHVDPTDSGSGSETFSSVDTVLITEEGLGVDIVYLTQGEISLDGVDLPHVLVVNVDEPSVVQDLPIMDGLPYRRQVAKKGRLLRIQGWTDSLATLEALREYADGQKHLLLLPTGDSMSILVSDVQTPEDVTKYTIYNYTITAAEAVD